MSEHDTFKNLLPAFILALLANLSYYAWVFGEEWLFTRYFPLSWMHACISYISVFFHEIGHTTTMWFYGFIAAPSFDFAHGGGMSWMLSDKQQMPLLFIIWLLLIYMIWYCRGALRWQLIFAFFLIFNLVTFSTSFKQAVIAFMGHGLESLVASLFLYRAFFNLTTRAPMERFFHFFVGFGIFMHNYILAVGLLKSSSYRLSYFHQKGAHGFGDFDQLGSMFHSLGFEGIIGLWILFNTVLLISPIVLYVRYYYQNCAGLSDD